jgi:hypothetical protein
LRLRLHYKAARAAVRLFEEEMNQKKYIDECGAILLLILCAFIITSCSNHSAISDNPIPGGISSEQPKEVTLCDVLGNPAVFNHKLIKISGVVSRGFEDFTLNDT